MADFDKSTDSAVAVAEEHAYDVPPSGLVVFFNDDYTTKDFVVEVLVSVFHKSEAEANALMEAVHANGSATIGVYAFDIAATRAAITVNRARAQGFPLRVEVREMQ
ncbi:MAG: ATP-dependent Clp protease adaptor ClpS [Treponema sp.]|nr:ATP-dependent Clp protease adaptor ClpS [Treponema sp.]